MAYGNTNIAISINQGGGQAGHVGHNHGSHGCRDKEGPEKPDRNPFLDFLTAPLQAIGKQGANQNDKEYAKYAHAHEAGNCLKGFH